MATDQSLWQKLRTGDHDAVFTLYKSMYNALYNYGFYLCKNSVVVEDGINDMFLELYDKRTDLPDVTNIKYYLFTYLRRKIYKEKKLLEQHDVLGEDVETLFENSVQDYLIQLQIESDTKNRILQAINKLSPKQKQIILLRFYENVSYEEIADRMNLSVRTIYNNVYEALKSLRTNLDPLYILILLMNNQK